MRDFLLFFIDSVVPSLTFRSRRRFAAPAPLPPSKKVINNDSSSDDDSSDSDESDAGHLSEFSIFLRFRSRS